MYNYWSFSHSCNPNMKVYSVVFDTIPEVFALLHKILPVARDLDLGKHALYSVLRYSRYTRWRGAHY